jgi:hypothetical protein
VKKFGARPLYPCGKDWKDVTCFETGRIRFTDLGGSKMLCAGLFLYRLKHGRA